MAAESTKFTFELPKDLKAQMDAHPEVNWSAVFREAIRRQAEAAEITRQILREQSDPRVRAVASELKKGVGERYRRLKHARRR